MIANRFQSFRRLGLGTAAAMGLYVVTSMVAAERTELERVDRQILAARQDIRQLQTELGARGSLRQLERWNGDVLALTTPETAQFLGARQLASLSMDRLQPVPAVIAPAVVSQPAVQLASAEPVIETAPLPRREGVREARATRTELAALSGDPKKLASLLDAKLVGELSRTARAEGTRPQ